MKANELSIMGPPAYDSIEERAARQAEIDFERMLQDAGHAGTPAQESHQPQNEVSSRPKEGGGEANAVPAPAADDALEDWLEEARSARLQDNGRQ